MYGINYYKEKEMNVYLQHKKLYYRGEYQKISSRNTERVIKKQSSSMLKQN